MVEKKTTKKTSKKTTKKAAVKKTAKPTATKKNADPQMITQDKATEMYAKRNKASGLDKEVHPFAMWGFISSVATFVIALIPIVNLFTIFLPPLGIILSAIGLNKIKKEPNKYKGRGFALAGIIVGAAIIVLGTIGIILFVAYLSQTGMSMLTY